MRRLLKLTSLASAFVMLYGCRPSLVILGSWTNPEKAPDGYKTILVTAIEGNAITRAALESDLALELSKAGVYAFRSIDCFPPLLGDDSLNRAATNRYLAENHIEAILTVSVMKKETDSRYIPGVCSYYPMYFGHYVTFWGYYSYWYPCERPESDYYQRNETYYIESNLYETTSEKLIWSAQSEAGKLPRHSALPKKTAVLMVRKLKQDNLLKPIVFGVKH